MRYPTFTSHAPFTLASCDACGTSVDNRGWQPKTAHVQAHVDQLLLTGERARALTQTERTER